LIPAVRILVDLLAHLAPYVIRRHLPQRFALTARQMRVSVPVCRLRVLKAEIQSGWRCLFPSR
ncbi:MAG: hypothetical protein PHV28_06050, partial [Kiritimatiellae bacterium]|nr:hypothetical protein [Kiritimatiellia bacterium]